MGRILKVILPVALCLVVVASVALVGCAEEEKAPLEAPVMVISQYLKGSTADFDAGVINTMSAGGGEGGFKSMGIGYSGVAVPACTTYADLTPAQKEVVDAWCVAFIDSMEAKITAGEPLETNPAYATLLDLSGMAWFGKWATGDYAPAAAFWSTWPDPAGRGGKCEFMDWIAANGLADVTGNDAYVWEGAGTGAKYCLQSAADRATIDADLATFLAKMQADANAANAAAATAGQTEIMKPQWADAFAAAMAAGFAASPDPYSAAFRAAFTAELVANWPAAYAAMAGAGKIAMMGVVMGSEAFKVLKVQGLPAAEGWKADVTATVPVHPRQAFYIWIAKPKVLAMAAAAPLIRLSVAEFSIKVTNPNEYWISLDSLTVNASIDVDWFGTVIPVDVAKVVLNEKVWVPPMEDDVKGEVTVRLLAPVKVYDVITWGVMAGYDSTKAGGLATFAFNKIQAGTAVWDVAIDAIVSAETGTITESYDLQWPTA